MTSFWNKKLVILPCRITLNFKRDLWLFDRMIVLLHSGATFLMFFNNKHRLRFCLTGNCGFTASTVIYYSSITNAYQCPKRIDGSSFMAGRFIIQSYFYYTTLNNRSQQWIVPRYLHFCGFFKRNNLLFLLWNTFSLFIAVQYLRRWV